MGRGARVDIIDLILQMGLIWHIPSRQNHLPSLPGIVSRLCRCCSGAAGAVVDRLPLKRVGARPLRAAVGAALAVPRWPAAYLRGQYSHRPVSPHGTLRSTPASQSLPPHLAPPEHLVRLSGVMQTFSPAGYIPGAALAVIYHGGHYLHVASTCWGALLL